MSKVQKEKQRITIRLDQKVVNWFKNQVEQRGSGNYQTLINNALLNHINQVESQADESLEETLRQVLREEGAIYIARPPEVIESDQAAPVTYPELNPKNPFEGIIGIFDGGPGDTAERAEEILSSEVDSIHGFGKS